MNKRNIILAKTAVWLLCLAPSGVLVFRALTSGLGANPVEFITLSTGTWTLVFLLTTLSITPLRKLTGQNWLIRFRRLIGLFAFFYGFLHLTTYVWLDKFFDFSEMVHDVVKRPFITAGMVAFASMLPLAVTSTAWSIRKLGGKNWNLLHKMIYLSGMAAVVHFWWKVKAGHREPAIYGAVLVAVLGYRVAVWAANHASRARREHEAAMARTTE